MNDEKITNKNTSDIEEIYSYKNNKGDRFYTPNPILAQARAELFGTDNVYVETYKITPKP
jgi:hypothetical protein